MVCPLLQHARYLYNNVVNYDTELGPGGEAVNKRPLDLPVRGAINIGTAGTVDPSSWWGEGGIVSRALNYVPGVNAVSGMHDTFQVGLDRLTNSTDGLARNILNIPGMLPAAVITYSALGSNLAPVIDALSVKKAR